MSLRFKENHYAIGINEDADNEDHKEGELLWKLIQRGDLPADRWQWGEFTIKTHAEVDKAYPGWRDVARMDMDDEDVT